MGAGDDHVTGSSQAQRACRATTATTPSIGLGGVDTLYGGEGQRLPRRRGSGHYCLLRPGRQRHALGGDGKTSINGGIGIDIIDGGDGNDSIEGGTATTPSTAAAGRPSGGDGNDTINGGTATTPSGRGRQRHHRRRPRSRHHLRRRRQRHDRRRRRQRHHRRRRRQRHDLRRRRHRQSRRRRRQRHRRLHLRAGSWNVDLTAETASTTGGVIPESVRNFEGARMGSGNDFVRGPPARTTLNGGAGKDDSRSDGND